MAEPERPATPPQPPSPPARRAGDRLVVILLAIAGVLIVGLSAALILTLSHADRGTKSSPSSARSAPAPSPTAITMRGTITMAHYDDPKSEFRSANWHGSGSLNCEGSGGYDDMVEGTGVTVYDGEGNVIAVGHLNAGLRLGDQCDWVFEIANVPDRPFYQVEVSHRGKVSLERANAGSVSLSLG